MTGLRAKKKANTAQKIIDEASRSFEVKGYDNTRIEDIAANTELSVATFYNYFRSKADILLSSITAETEIVLAEADKCISRSYETVEEAFDALVTTYFTTSFSKTPRSLWRIAVSQTMLNPNSEFCQKYVKMDDQLTLQSKHFIRSMQDGGKLRADVDADQIGELLFNNINMNFINFIRDDQLTAEDVCSIVNAQSAPIFALIACK